jgi:hypothetical protein
MQRNALTNIDGLSFLTSVGGTINIKVQSYTFLTVLRFPNSHTDFIADQHNVNLTNVNGLRSLSEVGGGVYIEVYHSQLCIGQSEYLCLTCAQWNQLITNVDGLRSLSAVPNGDLAIQVEELFSPIVIH